MRFLLAGALLFAPSFVFANVAISEVAWMGSADNANAEWLELYNDGASVDLTGWTLIAEDGQPAIALEGTITAGSYFLLERSSDASVPGITANQIYTGALSNAGELLQLISSDGAVVDGVDGLDGWHVGGDNESKFTLQRIGGEWVTAERTPRKENMAPTPVEEVSVENEEDEEQEQKSSSNATHSTTKSSNTKHSTSQTTIRLKPRLILDAGDDRVASVGVSVALTAHAYEQDGDELIGEAFTWNFGDGSTGAGRTVSHAWDYAGDYVVTVTARHNAFRETLEASDRFVVHVAPALVSISEANREHITLMNEGDQEADLSGWYLGYGSQFFRIPKGTILLAGSALNLARKVTSLFVIDPTQVTLFYPSRALATKYQPFSNEEEDVVDEETHSEIDVSGTRAHTSEYEVLDDSTVERSAATVATPLTDKYTATNSNIAAAAAQAPLKNNMWPWLLGVIGVVFVGVFATLLARREQENVLEGYSLEIDEGRDD